MSDYEGGVPIPSGSLIRSRGALSRSARGDSVFRVNNAAGCPSVLVPLDYKAVPPRNDKVDREWEKEGPPIALIA